MDYQDECKFVELFNMNICEGLPSDKKDYFDTIKIKQLITS